MDADPRPYHLMAEEHAHLRLKPFADRPVESNDVSKYEEFLGKGIPSKHSTFA
jgi:hypothetical protein